MNVVRLFVVSSAVAVFALAHVAPAPVLAADASATMTKKVAFIPPATPAGKDASKAIEAHASAKGPLVFSAPPRGSLEEERAAYQPVVDFLSKVTGQPIIFRYSDNWLSYSKDMTRGEYDLVFDGPAFNGWRLEKLQHTPLVKLPEPFVFVVITHANNNQVTSIKHLAGKRVCAHAPPNLGTLTMLSQFDNPARQPLIAAIKGWDNAFKAMAENKCAGTVVPIKNLEKNDKDGKIAKILYKHQALPNQALSAGPRIPTAMQDKIRQALLSEEGRAATSKLRSVYAGKDFVSATPEEYVGLGVYLKDMLYYAN